MKDAESDCAACQALVDARELFETAERVAREYGVEPMRMHRALVALAGIWGAVAAEFTAERELSPDEAAQFVEATARDLRQVLAAYLANDEPSHARH